ncbi:MAG: class I SAM-dependent methyltransferase [Desulfobacteraceae bacterium]|nr:class I SAM-dependent methyltransferase [Desulfobacteraceae bacterium]MBU4037278.1 class I SAM-dependent methyltransferase [Pseudomonadota bacterium]
MKTLIDSTFIRLIGQEALAWNHRLLNADGIEEVDFVQNRKIALENFRSEIQKNNIRLKENEKCQCGSVDFEKISSCDRFGMLFPTWICKSCGLISTSPVIDQQSSDLYYRKFYHPIHFDLNFSSHKTALYAQGQGEKIFRFVHPLLEDVKQLKILEVGMGTGSVLLEFKNAAFQSGIDVNELGTELNQECIRAAEKNGIAGLYGSFNEVIRQNMQFDLVILSHVFEHFVDLPAELEKLTKILKPSGLVYVEVPGVMSLHKKSEYDFDYLMYVTHAHNYHFNLTSLTQIFNLSGFELVRGNEEVETVFRKGFQRIDISKNYEQLKTYLVFLEQNRFYFSALKRGLNDMKSQLKAQEIQLQHLNTRIRKMESTWSWKITSPLRSINFRKLINR